MTIEVDALARGILAYYEARRRGEDTPAMARALIERFKRLQRFKSLDQAHVIAEVILDGFEADLQHRARQGTS